MIAWKRNRIARLTWSLLLVTALGLIAKTLTAAPFKSAPSPAWRTPINVTQESSSSPPADTTSNGSRYLLYDHQTRVQEETVESFTHVVRKISNEAGLQALSQLRIEFDATYQSLIFHSVVIHRGSDTFDRLALEAIKVVQREPMLEAQVYDGRQSAILFLNDLRVADVVEYAYTLRGSDPTMGGHFADGVLLGAPEPVDRLYTSILLPRGRHLGMSLQGPKVDRGATPTVESRGEFTQLTWDRRAVEAYAIEDGTPSWFDAFPWSQVSEFETWAQVAAFGARLFQVDVPKAGPLRQWVDKALKESSSPSEFESKVVRFVQDEVRYVAIEVGLARRRPTDPNSVFVRRYGDCKDKASLLATMLNMGGLRARPALVSTTRGQMLDQWVPSLSAFDHAIVRVDAPSTEAHWVDATLSLQGGDLERLKFSTYERALTLGSDTTHLDVLQPPPQDQPSSVVRDHFELSMPGSSDETRLDSERTYEGSTADMMRAAFRSLNREQGTKEFLRLYQNDFPGIHEVTPLEHFDDRSANVFRVTAHFSIPKFWAKDEKEDRYKAELVARIVERAFPHAVAANRVAPMSIAFPFHARAEMSFTLPFDLKIEPDRVAVSTPSIDFGFKSESVGGRALKYTYELQTRRNAITQDELTSRATDLDKGRAALVRSLTYRPRPADGFNWTALVGVLGCMPFLLWGTLRAYRYEPPARAASQRWPGPVGLGGWLILLGVNVVWSLVVSVVAVVRECRSAFSLAIWRALTTPELPTYRPALAVVIIAELIVMLGFLAYGVMLAFLFFGKRRSFPLQFAIYAVGGVVFLIADQAVASATVLHRSTSMPWAEIVGGALRAALWCTYVAKSRRVRATFVRSRVAAAPRSVAPSAEDHRLHTDQWSNDSLPSSDAPSSQ